MAYEEENLSLEQFTNLINKNLTENHWSIDDEEEFAGNNNLDFANKEDIQCYGFLSEKHGKHVLEAFETAKNQLPNSVPSLIQCENCEIIFAGECFIMHVCTHNTDKTPIMPTFIQEDVIIENEFQQGCRKSITQIEKNIEEIKKITFKVRDDNSGNTKKSTDGEARQSNHECYVCNRKFVHESGLNRHYDKHIGELLPTSSAEDSTLYAIVLCVFCGEAFTMEHKAWDHFLRCHLEVVNCGPSIKFLTNEFQFEINDLKTEPYEPPAKKRKLNDTSAKTSTDSDEQHEIRVEAQNLSINNFLRVIYVAKLFQCEFCDSVFTNAKSVLFHTSKHNPLSFFSCSSCDLDGITLKDLLLHRQKDCKNLHDIRDNSKDIPRLWICNVCDEGFRGIEHLSVHRQQQFHFFPRLNLQNNELIFTCDLCNGTFTNANLLISHLQDRHSKKPRITLWPETSTRVQKSPTSVKRGGGHQTSTRPRTYLCEVCGKSYTQSSHLWQHLRFHQGIKPFVCPEKGCGRRFTIRPDLNDHIRKCHTGERPFECTVCGKRFLTGSVYYQHRLIHRGERRYGCEECGKRFYRADALKNHVRIHSGEKPYKCWVEGCTKAFRQRGDRDKHVKARHKNAPPMPSPKRKRVISYGLGRTKNNTNLYSAKPTMPLPVDTSEATCSTSSNHQNN
ncbi:hypothetical protein PVAND_014106 [Polypedilum vanderplanki]|uniref:C2H2-type domain-containing protein n=1 Tax=Polypedilum vanderplanki TaxID=319348 RepID=A0A9J6CSH3_POLVA|nr:hypothetical protein PVAND_014106 [Polypedilum vanderplanki]